MLCKDISSWTHNAGSLAVHVCLSGGCGCAQGIKSHALWQAWALMEQRKGDVTYVRYLYRKCLDANPRSRYTYLSWGKFEEYQGRTEDAKALYRQGHQLNRRDPALLQV